ncbi:Glycosyltransferase [Quillaja saponaria]|uniref:Glycosyltransferase n=1 Tax=Quillaja saponaria TaxID=32244 RepID=A0AAD7Q4D1_QUISA|nr:Glycosyltransferase [Quillaja saponaria]
MGSISSDQSSTSPQTQHVVLFPFMAKGHTIPLLHFARLLLLRDLTVTFFTTPFNRPFIAQSLFDTTATIIDIPFPNNISDDIPAGTESTDKLPSLSLVYKFIAATKLMQPDFELALQNLPRVAFMVSDAFLWWTLDSTSKFDIPRLVFYGTSGYAISLSKEAGMSGFSGAQSNDELFALTRFPWIRLTKNDFDPEFLNADPNGLAYNVIMNALSASMKSYGLVVNSFYELEPAFIDYWKNESASKTYCLGPFCLAEPPKIKDFENKPKWILWLDQKLAQGRSVLYVAFGSQAEISAAQLKEIAIGLENSEVNFFWVMRNKGKKELDDEMEGFEERVKDRGIVVRDWVEQREILMHESVQGFLSHCGWNSVIESICAGVPILAWPMTAEQPLNARMVNEEIKVGLRVETCDGTVKGFVKWEGLGKMVRELMEGEKGEEVRKKVKEFAVMAKKAVEEGGSSWRTLDLLIDETCRKKEQGDKETFE